MKRFLLGLLVGSFMFVLCAFAGELQDKQHERELLIKDLRIVELQMERDTARLNEIRERFPRLREERGNLTQRKRKLDQEIKAIEEEEEVKENEKDTSSGNADSVPDPDDS